MDDKRLVQQAAARDVAAFVELTRRFQHFAFGAALILVRDFHRAEDVVQEAFIAAWEALPSLAEPAAFPGWLRAPDRLTEAREQAAAALAAIASLDAADVVIRLSRDRALAKIYPAVDVLTSRSRLLETKAVSDEHVTVAARVRQALSTLWSGAVGSDRTSLERALKIQNYFTQPFFCAEPYTKREGTTVSLAEALRTCREILDGEHDDVPTSSFYFSGGLAEIKGNLGRQLSFGPVQPLTKRSGDAARD